MKDIKKILVFPCGSEIGLEIHRALTYSKHFEIYGASSVNDHGRYVYKNYIPNIPFVNDKDFIKKLNEICKQNEINFIIPAHDDVVLKLAENQDNLYSSLVNSPFETCRIARSKLMTYKFFKNIIKTPKLYSLSDLEPEDFPIFVKPDIGQGSKGAQKFYDFESLELYCKKNKNLVISEFLPGDEYTIDCFTNSKGELLFSQGRVRKRINNGIAVNSVPFYDPEFSIIADKINNSLQLKGVWFFQLKRDRNGKLTLLEFASRIAGTMELYRVLGVNFIQMALFDLLGYEVRVLKNNFNLEIDRALSSKFKTDLKYKYIYIDLDDTIIINNKINPQIMQFLYQELNKQKQIILITKHTKNVINTLENYYIDKNIFSQIIQIPIYKSKSHFIEFKDSIFIDDSFAERYDISKKLNLPVFAPDAISTLLD